MSLSVRTAQVGDRDRIVEISSRIWEGEDYVPEVLDDWFADREGELAVAMLDGQIISFAHRTWLCPGIAWLEGIRTDPVSEGHGAARAITEHFIRGARAAGATHIELSTHVDNKASIHIIESYGFQVVGSFSYLERPCDVAPPEIMPGSASIRPISETETVEFVSHSEFLLLAQRRFPRGWRFFPFDHDPLEATARLECRLGIGDMGALKAAVCIRQSPNHGKWATINFLDGDEVAMQVLLNHALQLYAGKNLSMMVPIHLGQHAPVLGLLRDNGFKSWSEFKPDVFAYELV